MPLKDVGPLADRNSNPKQGAEFSATDTQQFFIAFSDGTWTDVSGGAGTTALLPIKKAVRVATTGNLTGTPVYNNVGGSASRGQITFSSSSTIDGVTLVNTDRILVKDESGGLGADANGLYVRTSALVWDRVDDYDEDSEVFDMNIVVVGEGTLHENTTWKLTTNNPITIGGASGTNLTYELVVKVELARTIIVAKSGGDESVIKTGLTAALALSPAPSATNPATVVVYPGIYSEANPIAVPPFVTLVGVGEPIIEAQTATSVLVDVAEDTCFRRFTVQGASGAGGVGVRRASVGTSSVDEIRVFDSETAFQVTGAGVEGTLHKCRAIKRAGEVQVISFQVTGANAIAEISDCRAISESGTIATGFLAENGGEFRGLGATATDCATGISADDDDTLVDLNGIVVRGATTGIRVLGAGTAGAGARIKALSCAISDTTTHVLLASASTGKISFIGAADEDKLSIPTGGSFNAVLWSEVSGDEAFSVHGELHVGSPTNPKESVFGGGDSHTTGMSVFTNTNLEIGSWADETADAASFSGSTFTLFPGVASNNAIFIGGDQEFPGLKTATTAVLALGAGTINLEYWDGATWVDLSYMVTDADIPYAQKGENPFGFVQSDQIRFGETTGWATKVLNGENKYWVRFTIGTAITTAPILEQVKLHTDRSEFNSDGQLEHFGCARPRVGLSLRRKDFDGIVGSTPRNQSIDFSTNINIDAERNDLNNNAVDSVGWTADVAEGIDTSLPVELEIKYAKDSAGSGNIELEVYITPAVDGDLLTGALTETVITPIVVAVPATADELDSQTISVDINAFKPGTVLAVALKRDATGGNADDTYAGGIYIVEVRGTARRWK